jgi:N-terminal TM domain of oligopeptide transport permease C
MTTLLDPFVKQEDDDYVDAAGVIGDRFARNENYFSLVWRKFRRSTTGMLGLILVGLLLLTAVFADFVAPVDPKQPSIAFASPDPISFYTKQNGYQLWPVTYAIMESTELDPLRVPTMTIHGQSNSLSRVILTGFWASFRPKRTCLAPMMASHSIFWAQKSLAGTFSPAVSSVHAYPWPSLSLLLPSLQSWAPWWASPQAISAGALMRGRSGLLK